MVKAIILEDEPTAQEVLSELISIYAKEKVEIVGVCFTIEEAVDLLIRRTDIQLIFLDIQLGEGRSGFELFKYLSPEKHTVIFTTAFEKHAIKALKLNAIDYLVKPIHFPDLILAINKAVESIKIKANSFYLETIYNELKNHNLDLKFNKLAILKGDEYIFIPFSRINYLEGDGNYTKIFTLDGEKFQTPRTLKTYEEILPKELFYRIHKSYLINLNCIKKYIRNEGNLVYLHNDICLSVSKRKAEDFLRVIQSGISIPN
jgi:two-component system, LytTR family, response regulator